MRILITGSRDWTDATTIHMAIFHAFWGTGFPSDQITVVHGGARGADSLAGERAKSMGLNVEVHRADWNRHGRRAGYLRNAEMVGAGADVCLAFIKDESRGATMCANLAEKAGIPVTYCREFSFEIPGGSDG